MVETHDGLVYKEEQHTLLYNKRVYIWLLGMIMVGSHISLNGSILQFCKDLLCY